VTSAHVQAAVARSIADGRSEKLLPRPLRDLLGPLLVDENSSSASVDTGKCAQPCACISRYAAVEFMMRARPAHGARAGGRPDLQDGSVHSRSHDAGALPPSPFSPAYAPPAFAYSTPPPSSMRPAVYDLPATRPTSASPTLTRTVNGLQDAMEREAWRKAMLIALNPRHIKYSVLRSVVDVLGDNRVNMAFVMEALVQEPP
jgi:hypothetical protein